MACIIMPPPLQEHYQQKTIGQPGKKKTPLEA